jgi:hypothetical protein
MLICKKCLCEIKEDFCPICGKKKCFREAKDSDEIFLTSADFIFYKVIEDILTDNGISYVKKGTLGSAVSFYVGDGAETFNFYVMLKDYEAAVSAVSHLDAEVSEEELNEYIDSYEGEAEE